MCKIKDDGSKEKINDDIICFNLRNIQESAGTFKNSILRMLYRWHIELDD